MTTPDSLRLDLLPVGVLLNIFRFVAPQSVSSVALVCRTFFNVIDTSDLELWMFWCLKHWNSITSKLIYPGEKEPFLPQGFDFKWMFCCLSTFFQTMRECESHSGQGTLQDAGNTYIGEWCHGQWNGRGILLQPRPFDFNARTEVFAGEFLGGQKNGKGIQHFASGDRYEGEWRDDMKQGFGIYSWRSGSRFEGEFKENQRAGLCRFFWPNGDMVEGEWAADLPVNPEQWMHPDIRRSIAQKKCTRSVEGTRTKRGQIYFHCSCRKRLCVVCRETCHNTCTYDRSWSALNNCGCRTCEISKPLSVQLTE